VDGSRFGGPRRTARAGSTRSRGSPGSARSAYATWGIRIVRAGSSSRRIGRPRVGRPILGQHEPEFDERKFRFREPTLPGSQPRGSGEQPPARRSQPDGNSRWTHIAYYGYGYGYVYDPFYSYYYSPYYRGYGYWNPWGYGYGLGYFSYDPYLFGGIGDPGYGGGYGSSGGGSSVQHYQGAGSLRLKIKPANAQVYIDGYFVGVVDSFDGVFQKLNVDAGPHRVELKAEGYETTDFEVVITPGDTITYKGDMKRK
jgi:PEGA domain-containing protein